MSIQILKAFEFLGRHGVVFTVSANIGDDNGVGRLAIVEHGKEPQTMYFNGEGFRDLQEALNTIQKPIDVIEDNNELLTTLSLAEATLAAIVRLGNSGGVSTGMPDPLRHIRLENEVRDACNAIREVLKKYGK